MKHYVADCDICGTVFFPEAREGSAWADAHEHPVTLTWTDAMISWDEWGLGVALAVSRRGDCLLQRAGAVICDWRHHIIATGHNGTITAIGCLEGACPRARSAEGECAAIHAEINALMQADASRRQRGTMYCTGMPCDVCMRILSGSGLAVLVHPDGKVAL